MHSKTHCTTNGSTSDYPQGVGGIARRWRRIRYFREEKQLHSTVASYQQKPAISETHVFAANGVSLMVLKGPSLGHAGYIKRGAESRPFCILRTENRNPFMSFPVSSSVECATHQQSPNATDMWTFQKRTKKMKVSSDEDTSVHPLLISQTSQTSSPEKQIILSAQFSYSPAETIDGFVSI